jgi:hypothetical protein
MNNRKQQINSLLNSITSKELDNYIRENQIHNKELINNFKKVKNTAPDSHMDKIMSGISDNFGKVLNSYYKAGQAWVIAFVLECFYNDKYKISDLQKYMKALIKDNKELKEYVYEIMKDF